MYFCFQSNGEEVSIFAFDIKANSESQVMIYTGKPFMGWIVLGKYVHVFACCIYIILSYRRHGWKFSVSWLTSVTAAQILFIIFIIKVHFQS